MDAYHAYRTLGLAGTMLALAGVCRSVGAGETTIQLHDSPSMLVVAASDGETLEQPSTPGVLSVVANGQRQGPLPAILYDPDVTPAGYAQATRGNQQSTSFSGGPRRPNASAGIQTQPGDRLEAHSTARYLPSEPVAPATAAAQPLQTRSSAQPPSKRNAQAKTPSRPAAAPSSTANRPAAGQQTAAAQPTDPGSQRLVRAYELSLTASSEAEFSQIVRWCAEAMRHGLEGENRRFGLELSAWALNRRGQLRADAGQNDLAIADFRAALDFDPACWRALHNCGVTLAQRGQFAEAFDDICKVIELNPQFAKAFSNRATLYVQAGDVKRALRDFETALRLDPALMPALVGHGRVCHLEGRLEEALASFDAATHQDSVTAEIVCSRGDLLVDLGRYSEALQDYARAIDLDPKFEHAYRNGAWLLATCPDDGVRDAEAALKGAQAALECGYGERHAALDTLAAALANAGRYDEAVGTMQQAIDIAPEEARPAYHARQELYETGQPFRAHPVSDVETAEFIEG